MCLICDVQRMGECPVWEVTGQPVYVDIHPQTVPLHSGQVQVVSLSKGKGCGGGGGSGRVAMGVGVGE